jgi:hypothetical protein
VEAGFLAWGLAVFSGSLHRHDLLVRLVGTVACNLACAVACAVTGKVCASEVYSC